MPNFQFVPITYKRCISATLTAICLTLGGSIGFAQQQKEKQEKSAVTIKQSPTVRAEAAVIDGMKYMMRGEPDLAIPIFRKVIELFPNDPSGHFLLANALVKNEQIEEGTTAARVAYEGDKDNIFYGKFLADQLTRQKKYTEAVDVYEHILKLDPSSIQNNIELAAVYVFTDQFDKAIQTYNQLEKIVGVTEEVSRQKQQLYLRQNALQKAIDEAKNLITSDPEEISYQINLAEMYLANELLPDAEKLLVDIVKRSPDHAQGNVLLADIYQRQGNDKKAMEQLQVVFKNNNYDATPKIRVLSGMLANVKTEEQKQSALVLTKELADAHPKDPRVHVIHADLLVQNKQLALARDAYAKAARLDGSVYEVWGALIQLDGELNQLDSMIVHSELALEMFPNQGMLWYSNGSANLVKGNHQAAIAAFEESRRLIMNNPEMILFINAQLGDAYNGVKDYAKSDAAYEAVLKVDPENDHVLNNYSYFLSLRKEKLDHAASMASRLVKRHPDNSTYLDTYAWVLYVQKDYEQAKIYLERAIKADKNVSATIVEHYGDVFYQLGNPQKALEQWKKAKEIGKGSEFLEKKIATGKLHE